jgi:hypothetical protein
MLESLLYVINAHLFWHSMGMTVATAMLIGAICHNGDFGSVRKLLIVMIPFVAMLLFISLARLYPNISKGQVFLKTYASFWTIILASIAYITGLFAGVSTWYISCRGKKCFPTSHNQEH